jgi:hypothetical protein
VLAVFLVVLRLLISSDLLAMFSQVAFSMSHDITARITTTWTYHWEPLVQCFHGSVVDFSSQQYSGIPVPAIKVIVVIGYQKDLQPGNKPMHHCDGISTG